MKKPNPKLYGWQEPTHDDPGGWMLEDGEGAYWAAVEEWQGQQPIEPDPVVDAALKDYPQLKGKTRKERRAFLINAISEAMEVSGDSNSPIEPFFCLDEGDGKPRCRVQCPFCERV